MPALVNSSVGSSSGTTLLDGTAVWPCFWTKKSRNCWRISLALGISNNLDGNRGGLLSLLINLAEGDPVLPGDAGAILILRREDRRPSFQPTELPLHRPPG